MNSLSTEIQLPIVLYLSYKVEGSGMGYLLLVNVSLLFLVSKLWYCYVVRSVFAGFS